MHYGKEWEQAPLPVVTVCCDLPVIVLQCCHNGIVTSCRSITAYVCLIYLSWITLQILTTMVKWFWAFILAPLGMFRTDIKKYGTWAGTLYVCVVLLVCSPRFMIDCCVVVTGASEGIGRGYAHEVQMYK